MNVMKILAVFKLTWSAYDTWNFPFLKCSALAYITLFCHAFLFWDSWRLDSWTMYMTWVLGIANTGIGFTPLFESKEEIIVEILKHLDHSLI